MVVKAAKALSLSKPYFIAFCKLVWKDFTDFKERVVKAKFTPLSDNTFKLDGSWFHLRISLNDICSAKSGFETSKALLKLIGIIKLALVALISLILSNSSPEPTIVYWIPNSSPTLSALKASNKFPVSKIWTKFLLLFSASKAKSLFFMFPLAYQEASL